MPGASRGNSSGSHVGGTAKGGPHVAGSTRIQPFVNRPMSSAQVAIVRQRQPVPAPIHGMRNARPVSGPVRRYPGGPTYTGEF